MSFRNRLRKVEEVAGGEAGGEACEECGGPPEPGMRVEYEVLWEGLDEPSDTEGPGSPEYCPECGRQLIITIRWADQE